MQAQFTEKNLQQYFYSSLSAEQHDGLLSFIDKTLHSKSSFEAHPLAALQEKLNQGKQLLQLVEKKLSKLDVHLLQNLKACINELDSLLEKVFILDEQSQQQVFSKLRNWLNELSAVNLSFYSIFTQWCQIADEDLLLKFSSEKIQQIRAEALNKWLYFNQLWQQLISVLSP